MNFASSSVSDIRTSNVVFFDYYVTAHFPSYFRRNFVQDIHQKTGQLMSRGSATPVGSGGVADYSGTLQVRIKETSSKVKGDIQ